MATRTAARPGIEHLCLTFISQHCGRHYLRRKGKEGRKEGNGKGLNSKPSPSLCVLWGEGEGGGRVCVRACVRACNLHAFMCVCVCVCVGGWVGGVCVCVCVGANVCKNSQ